MQKSETLIRGGPKNQARFRVEKNFRAARASPPAFEGVQIRNSPPLPGYNVCNRADPNSPGNQPHRRFQLAKKQPVFRHCKKS
jgi:hypothetical protein